MNEWIIESEHGCKTKIVILINGAVNWNRLQLFGVEWGARSLGAWSFVSIGTPKRLNKFPNALQHDSVQ